MQNAPHMGSKVFRFGDFVIDEAKRELRRGGAVVSAQPLVLDVLSYLARHRDRPVTRQELIESVWAGVHVSDGAVATAIYEARVALGDDGRQQRIIRTLYGRGFQITADLIEEELAEDREVRPPAKPEQGLPFVGREAVFDRLDMALDEARQARGKLVLLSGDAGVGKTRTTQEFLIRTRGARGHTGRCHEGPGAPPFWPWVQILRERVDRTEPEVLERQVGAALAPLCQLIPDLAARIHAPWVAPAEGSPESRFQLFDAIAGFLRSATEDEPLVLVLDDLHWADPASLLLLEFLARDLSNMRMLVIATYREEELGDGNPLVRSLGALVPLPHCLRVPLQGLDRSEVRALMGAMTGVRPTRDLLHAVFQRTEGNPFFVSEVVGLLQEGNASAVEVVESTVPRAVIDTVVRRLSRLEGETLEVLRVASVIGREFSLDLLARVIDLETDRLRELLEEASQAAVVGTDTPEAIQYRFRHTLIRETLYSKIPSLERARIHRRVADTLEKSGGAEAPYSHLAHHASEAAAAGDFERSVAFARRAGEEALAVFAYEDAALHFGSALRALESRKRVDDQSQVVDLLLCLGDAQSKAAASKAARQSFERAAEAARRAGEVDKFARAAVGFTGSDLHFNHAVGTRIDLRAEQLGLHLLEEALDRLPSLETAIRARVLGALARQLHACEQRERASGVSQQAIEMAQRLGDPEVLAEVTSARRMVLWGPENVEERIVIANDIVELASRGDNPALELTGRAWLVVDMLEKGDLASVRDEMGRCERLAGNLRQARFLYLVAVLRATLALLDGRLNESEDLAQRALRLGLKIQSPSAMGTFFVQLIALRREQGRLHELEWALRGAVSRMPDALATRTILMFIYTEMDRLEDAKREYEILAARDFRDFPRDRTWLSEITTLALTCCRIGDERRAEILYNLLLPYARRNVVVADGLMSYGSVSQQLGMLSTLLGRFDDAERHFDDAIAMMRRIGARAYIAYTFVLYAEMYLARGNAGDAERARAHLEQAYAVTRAFELTFLGAKVEALLARIAA